MVVGSGNRFWILRHGKSIPNHTGVIASSLEYSHRQPRRFLFLSLPFPASHKCMVVEDLRERYFGPTFEHMSHDKYADIWALDEKDPFMPPPGKESVAHVAARLTSAINHIDSLFQGCAILIVSHGDPFQILQTMVNATVNKQGTIESESGCGDLRSRLEAVQTAAVLSQHRNYVLATGELCRLILTLRPHGHGTSFHYAHAIQLK